MVCSLTQITWKQTQAWLFFRYLARSSLTLPAMPVPGCWHGTYQWLPCVSLPISSEKQEKTWGLIQSPCLQGTACVPWWTPQAPAVTSAHLVQSHRAAGAAVFLLQRTSGCPDPAPQAALTVDLQVQCEPCAAGVFFLVRLFCLDGPSQVTPCWHQSWAMAAVWWAQGLVQCIVRVQQG